MTLSSYDIRYTFKVTYNLLILQMMWTKLLNCRHIYPFGNNIRDIFQRESFIDMRRNQSHFSTSKRTKLFIREKKIFRSFSNWGVSIKADRSNRIAAKGRMPWMVAIMHHFYVLILISFFSLLFWAEIVQTTFIQMKIKSSYFSSQKKKTTKSDKNCVNLARTNLGRWGQANIFTVR